MLRAKGGRLEVETKYAKPRLVLRFLYEADGKSETFVRFQFWCFARKIRWCVITAHAACAALTRLGNTLRVSPPTS